MKKRQKNWTGVPEDSMGFLISDRDEFKYDVPFRIKGVQVTDIDNNIVGAWRIEIKDDEGKPVIYKSVKNYGQWIIRKREISDKYIDFFDLMEKDFQIKEVVRFIVQPVSENTEIIMR